MAQTHIRKKFQCPIAPLPSRQPRFGHGELDVFESGQDREQVKALKDETQTRETQPGKLTIRQGIQARSQQLDTT